jgi:hypothetical protein
MISSAVAFTPKTNLVELIRGLKVSGFAESQLSMVTLLEGWNMMCDARCLAVEIFGTIESVENTVLTQQSTLIAMLNLNHFEEYPHVIF